MAQELSAAFKFLPPGQGEKYLDVRQEADAEIDGDKVLTFRFKSAKDAAEWTLWIDPRHMFHPVRLQGVMADGTIRRTDYSKWYDTPPPELFGTDVPTGYTTEKVPKK